MGGTIFSKIKAAGWGLEKGLKSKEGQGLTPDGFPGGKAPVL